MSTPFGDNVEDVSFVKPESMKGVPPRRKTEKDKTPPRYTPGKYKDSIEEFYTAAGMLCTRWAPNTAKALIEPFEKRDGDTVKMTTGAEQCAISIDEWAKVNPKVRSILDKVTTGGVIMAVVTAHSPILISAAGELGLFSQMGNVIRKFRKEEYTNTAEQPLNGFEYSNPGAAVA